MLRRVATLPRFDWLFATLQLPLCDTGRLPCEGLATKMAAHPNTLRLKDHLMADSDDFQLEWHGGTVVIIPASNVESMSWDLIEQAAQIVMAPIQDQEIPMVVVDLGEVTYFGSVFLALLLRCHKFVKSRGGELVLCGASDMASELLRVTALDTLWAIYDTREEALDAIGS